MAERLVFILSPPGGVIAPCLGAGLPPQLHGYANNLVFQTTGYGHMDMSQISLFQCLAFR